MGKPGPRKKPRKVRKIQGFPGKARGDSLVDARPDQKARTDQVAAMRPPSWLKKIPEATEVWEELLRTMPVIPAPHQTRTFADFCICLATLKRLELRIRKEGFMMKGKKHPLLQTAKDHRGFIQRWAPEFYLTPASSESRIRSQQNESVGSTLSGCWNPKMRAEDRDDSG